MRITTTVFQYDVVAGDSFYCLRRADGATRGTLRVAHLKNLLTEGIGVEFTSREDLMKLRDLFNEALEEWP